MAHPLEDALLTAMNTQAVRNRLPERLRVQDPNDPVTATLVTSVWAGTVARVLARGSDLHTDDLPLALEAVIAGVTLKLEQALYPEQGDDATRSMTAEFLALLDDVEKVSDARATGAGRHAGGQPLGHFERGDDPWWWRPVLPDSWGLRGAHGGHP